MDWESDRMREKALSRGRSVTFEEWAAMSADFKRRMSEVGIVVTTDAKTACG